MADGVFGWTWRKIYAPPQVLRKPNNLVTILGLKLSNPKREGDVGRFRKHPLCLITGDGRSLPENVKEFESWDILHDLYCVNRSLLFFERPVDHWAAIDIE